ncbi:MAG: undecaprenyl-phosphate galactose phosphotransferase [Microgenomates bacterium 39_6]|nr:MAG: undecaprenyl-phosphate galactose phosphotransferase [Microgenomates bacterium 39_6]
MLTKDRLYYPLKRLSDIVLAVLVGIVTSPICLITAIAIKLDSPGPILADVPPRVGKNRQPFKILKFRSMIPNAHQMIRQDPKFKKAFAELKKNNFKLKNDPRITRVGKFIRKYSIDELPQLINVLKGEMSLVGPRPYYPDELAEYEKQFPQTKKLIEEALTVKPGITGLWQVSGRSDVNFEERIALDAQYARRKNLIDDIIILVKSPWVVLTGKGAS